jgi:ubiquinone/menaquinone biosynthesis C-methylase UbiE
MSTGAELESQKGRSVDTFNALAHTYDVMRFLSLTAARLVDLAQLNRGTRVLDVATGTGEVALLAARAVGPAGTVIGIDLSPGMLARARAKAAQAGLSQVEFREGDALRLDLPDESFDVVLSASSLFILPDMAAAVREWRRVLAPGGRLGFSSFGPSFLQPLREMWAKHLRAHGLGGGAPPTERLSEAEACRDLLRQAGLTPLDAHAEQLGYYLRTVEERWLDIEVGLEGVALGPLDPGRLAAIRQEHLAELEGILSPQGLWVDVPALFAFGRALPAA